MSDLLNQLGFDSDHDYIAGLVKYVHPDLEIQFLTPELGRVKDKPYEMKKLNINAEGLTYMKMLQDYKFNMNHNGISVWLPTPEVYSLHKILISQKRKKLTKREKDLISAKNIGELCLEYETHRKIKKLYMSICPKNGKKL